MAKLCRIHFSGLGIPAARFHPLTIDLRDPRNGSAQDSVLWLRNGGGKTTLISLLYSTLIPDKRQFLGKLLGKDCGVADFVRNNELGVVLTEWEFPAQIGAPRRIVGQGIKCVDGEPTRAFFSFASTQEFDFDHVPVLGLKTNHPAKTLEELLEGLRQADTSQAGRLGLVIPVDQHEWRVHLEKVGLDQELFEAHLKMNKQEGGAAELFKLKSADDFLRLFLDLIMDEESTREEEKSLEALRVKVLQTPDREAAVAFGTQLRDGLEKFASEAEILAARQKEEQRVARSLASAAKSVQERIAELRQQEQAAKTRRMSAETDLAGYTRERERLGRHVRGYQRRAKELRISEAALAVQQAEQQKVVAQHQAQVIEAAVPWAAAQRCQVEITACQQSLEAARTEHRPELETVKRLGFIAAASWEAEMANAEQESAKARARQAEAKHALQEIQNTEVDLEKLITRSDSEHQEASRALERRKQARDRLRSQGVLEPDEKPDAAKGRWSQVQDEAGRNCRKATEEKQEELVKIAQLRQRLQGVRKSKEAKGRELERLQNELEAGEAEHAAIGRLSCVTELCAGKPGDPRNPWLLHNLEDQRDNTQNQLIALRIETADEERSELHLRRDGLTAPSRDLETVLAWLSEDGIKSALPAYRWLAEHRSESQAREMLDASPATWSGILIQTPEDWQKLAGQNLELPIKGPVLLTFASAEIGETLNPDCKTVVPQEGAMFCKAQAELYRAALQERRAEQQTREEKLRDRLAILQQAVGRIKSFNEKWPKDAWDRVSEQAREAEQAKQELEREEQQLENSERQVEAHVQVLIQRERDQAKAEATAVRQLAQLETFLTDHESQAERWSNIYLETERAAEKAKADLINLNSLRNHHQLLQERAQNSATLAAQRQAQFQTRRNRLPAEYIGNRPSEMHPLDAEAAEKALLGAITAYEGKIHRGEFEGRIMELEKQRQERLNELAQRRGDASENEIATAGGQPNLQALRQASQEILVEASSQASAAQNELQAANQDRPRPLSHAEGSDISETEYGPRTKSAECLALAQELEERQKQVREKEDSTKTARDHAERATADLGHRANRYEDLLAGLQGVVPGAERHADFSENDEENRQLVQRLARQTTQLQGEIARRLGMMQTIYDEKIQATLRDARYDKRQIEFRDRLLRLSLEDLKASPQDHLQAVKTQVAVAQAQLDSLNQEKAVVVEQMERLASRARNWCEQATKVSTMGSTMGAWANQPFLQIQIVRRSDPAERLALLTKRVDEWFQKEGNLPRGAELAFQCLQALGAGRPPSIKILKPQYVRDAASHDITELAKFSDGERLTTAILLYCVLVRLRARHRGHEGVSWAKDSGLLLLDNPFGKATLAELVDLQVQTAQQMGVQLVYATGINDFAALKHFGHLVRLRNSSRNRANGDFHVKPDDRPVEVAIVGHRSNGQ